jgi:hypothetical protein
MYKELTAPALEGDINCSNYLCRVFCCLWKRVLPPTTRSRHRAHFSAFPWRSNLRIRLHN